MIALPRFIEYCLCRRNKPKYTGLFTSAFGSPVGLPTSTILVIRGFAFSLNQDSRCCRSRLPILGTAGAAAALLPRCAVWVRYGGAVSIATVGDCAGRCPTFIVWLLLLKI